LVAARSGTVDTVEIPLNLFDAAPVVDQRVQLYLPGAALLRQARAGYGLPLAGLVLGALAGHGIALAVGGPPDATAALFAIMGTLAGFRASKRASSHACRVRPADPPRSDNPPSIERNNEDCTS
jgi:positive regulator of sigma E activity